jgi:tRNA-dihydrouridine synthase B
LLQPLKIANRVFPINLIQGPLAGYSCSAFRLLTWEYSQPAFTCTEMISCNALAHQPKLSYRRYIEKDQREGPVCFQIFGKDPDRIGYAAKVVTDYGADLIDLNCGCPVKKVRRQGAGSSLLTDAVTLYKLLVAMKKNTHLPIAAKIRVEGSGGEKFHNEIVKVVSDAGIDFLIVHGRHWTETYKTPCHYDHIKFFVDELKIPVIGNGDVFCINSLKRMFATGCAGVMVARAGMGQPWFIQKLIAEMKQQEFIAPSVIDIRNIFIRHIQLLEKLLGSEKFALLHARKIAGLYMHGLPNKKDFCHAVNNCHSLSELENICVVDYALGQAHEVLIRH